MPLIVELLKNICGYQKKYLYLHKICRYTNNYA